MTASVASKAIQQHIIPLARRDQFIKRLAIPTCCDIRNRAVGEIIARDRDGFPQIGGEFDSEFGVQVFAGGAHEIKVTSHGLAK